MLHSINCQVVWLYLIHTEHSFTFQNVIDVIFAGAVFGWGKNRFGQLGLNSEIDHKYPAQLKTLRSIRVKYIACGEDFSVFLTQVRKLLLPCVT